MWNSIESKLPKRARLFLVSDYSKLYIIRLSDLKIMREETDYIPYATCVDRFLENPAIYYKDYHLLGIWEKLDIGKFSLTPVN